MERKEFLEMCQKVSLLSDGLFNTKKDVPSGLVVFYNGKKYYPWSYELSFEKGNAKHSAILHELHKNSIIKVNLEKVM